MTSPTSSHLYTWDKRSSILGYFHDRAVKVLFRVTLKWTKEQRPVSTRLSPWMGEIREGLSKESTFKSCPLGRSKAGK